MKEHLQAAGVIIYLICYYVDDVRMIISHLSLGWKWRGAQVEGGGKDPNKAGNLSMMKAGPLMT